jgi:HEAT repeat protein
MLLKVNGEQLELLDALAFAHPRFRGTWAEEGLKAALKHPQAEIRLRAVEYLSWCRTTSGLSKLFLLIKMDPDERVGRAAVEAIADQGLKEGQAVLVDCLQDPRAGICLAAKSALRRFGEVAKSKQRTGRSSNPEGESSLVEIIS